MPNLFPTHAAGDILTHDTDWNNSFSLIESSYLDIGSFVVSGLTLSAGSGLVAAVASGKAMIGAEVVVGSSFNIAGLADNSTNFLFLLQNGTGSHNTTGVAPANSAYLGTATTVSGSVTATSTAGRPQGPLTNAFGLPGLAAGAAAGSSPPAPVLVAGSNDDRGAITFGTGTGPTAGQMVVVTYAAPLLDTAFITISPLNSLPATLSLYVQSYSNTGFTIAAGTGPAASQPNTTYGFSFSRRK